MYKDVFRFPAHNKKTGCCFKCNVTPAGIRDFGSDARWRQPENRLGHFDVLARMLGEGSAISPLFSVPGVQTPIFCIDWLHCCDLGVAADFLGNFFYTVAGLLPGESRTVKTSALFLEMRQWYQDAKVENKLDNLTVLMIRKSAKHPPKLRGKAAEIRGLVPFGVILAEKYLRDGDLVHETVADAAHLLAKAYECLGEGIHFDATALQDISTKFCLLYSALESMHDGVLWRIKPKFHLWQELCHLPSNPTSHWVYRDEDFGGSCAQWSRSKGGPDTVWATGTAVLESFRCKHEPWLM